MENYKTFKNTLNETTANFDAMIQDMKRAMSQGKTITMTAKEAHTSDRYKGQVYEYSIK